MKYALIIILIKLSVGFNYAQENLGSTIISQPVLIEDDDWSFHGTENILFVPENRNVKASRKIGLHFFKFPAKVKSTLPPVVFLGAGPGEPYSVEVFYNGKRAEAWRYELNFVNQYRDVILINQRGNSNAPGLPISNFKYKWNNGGSLDKPFDLALMNQNRRAAYADYIKKYQELGVDLKGYDILHFIDDIESVRQHCKIDKLALIGNSFATQWALGYLQRYPQYVDRALLSGIEPLDNNYDDPAGIWEVLRKIDAYAMRDPTLASQIPSIGLIEAFKEIIVRLENEPVSVTLKDEDGEDETIVIGADDLRYSLLAKESRSYLGEIESWPKYITEMYNGDFRVLASGAFGRVYNSSSLMINPLVNNSLGISKAREQILNNRPAKRWLGNVNAHYTSTRDICPAPKVSEEFLHPKNDNIPIVFIQGDMDLSTPYENVESLAEYLKNGYLLTVKRGFHNAKRALIFADSTLTNKIYSFMNLDFEKESFQEFKSTLPAVYEMPPFEFWPIEGEALYEKFN